LFKGGVGIPNNAVEKKRDQKFSLEGEEKVFEQLIETTPFALREARKVPLIAEERVMLHLLRFSRFQDQWEVPFAVTQKGISNATKILRNNIPRTMKKLIEKGFAIKKTLHIRGAVKRRTVYFLTPEGLRKAKSMEENLRVTTVRLKDLKGKIKKVKIGEISKYLTDNNTPLLDIIHHLSEDSIFDCRTYQTESVVKEKGPIDFAMHIPKPKYFFNRKKELTAISKWLRSDTSKVMVIYGIAGCGKTTLASRVVEYLKTKMNVFWYQFHEWDTLRNVLTALSKFLAQLGRKEIKTYINTSKNIDINEVSELLEVQLQGLNAVFVFDDVHKMNDEIVSFFLGLRERIERIDKIKIITLGRHLKSFYDSRDIVIKKLVTEMHLGGLDEEGSRKLLKLRNVKEFDRIYKLTEGHPLFLELIESPDDLKNESNPRRYIHEQIFSKLTDDEKSVLKFLSVFRYPVDQDVLAIDPDVGYETLRNLKYKSLIHEVSPDRYNAHEFVKEFFYGTLTPQLKQRYHKAAAEHYMKLGDGFASLEAQHHFLNAGVHEQAAKIAIEYGPELIKNGRFDEFMRLLNRFNPQNVSTELLVSINILKANILTASTRYEEALRHYNDAKTLNKKLKSPAKEAEICRNIGDMYEKRNALGQALENYEQSLELSKLLHNPKEIAKTYKGLGRIHRKMGEGDKALECLGKSLEILKRQGLELEAAKCYNYLGRIFVERGELDKALEQYEESMALSEKLNDPYLTGLTAFMAAYAYNSLGMGNNDKHLEDLLEHHERYVKISKKMGYKRGMAYGLNNAGKNYAKRSEFEKATDYIEKVLKTSKKLDEKLLRSFAYTNYGILYKNKKEWDKSIKYFNDSIKILESLGMPHHLGDTYFEAALAYKGKGNKRKAVSYLTKALDHYRELGATDKIEMMKEMFEMN